MFETLLVPRIMTDGYRNEAWAGPGKLAARAAAQIRAMVARREGSISFQCYLVDAVSFLWRLAYLLLN